MRNLSARLASAAVLTTALAVVAQPAAAQDVRLSPPATAGRGFYGSAEYLNWWVKDAPLRVPLISTGPASNLNGDLFNSNSTIVYGAPQSPGVGGRDHQDFGSFSGGRLTLGYRIDPVTGFGVEASGFGLQSKDAGIHVSGTGGTAGVGNGLRVPLFNTTPYFTGGPIDTSAGENGLPIFLPGIIGGSAVVNNTSNLWGFDLSATYDLLRGPNYVVTGLAGVRYLDLSEGLDLVDHFFGTGGPFVGQSGTVGDHFGTRNRFVGPMLGVRGTMGWGPFSVTATGRVGFGPVSQDLNVGGHFDAVNFFVSSGNQGIFAQPSNSGHRSSTDFAVNPEFQLKLGYDVTPNIRLTIGYDFLYLSSVIRPGDQIDRNIPKGQVFMQGGPSVVTSTTQPSSLFRTTDFYAQGLSAGVTFRF
jgi:hypothetical protein